MRLNVVKDCEPLFRSLCDPCPRYKFCSRTPGKRCGIGPDRKFFWELENQKVDWLGGIDPKALGRVLRQPRLPLVLHVHSGSCPWTTPWRRTLGVSAKHVLDADRGYRLNSRYLRKSGLTLCPKVLQFTGKDPLLRRLLEGCGEQFLSSLNRCDIQAIIVSNLSAYDHADHSTWLDNRAMCQNFLNVLLRAGLPGILHTYLEDAPVHQGWLVDYLRLNPEQHYIATGFDRRRGQSISFVERRLQMLAEVEQAIGRELHIVLCSVLMNLKAIAAASRLFPGRVHLVSQSVFMASVKGRRIEWDRRSGCINQSETDWRYSQGQELFLVNARRFDRLLRERVPLFRGD